MPDKAKGLLGTALVVWLCCSPTSVSADHPFDLKVDPVWASNSRTKALVTVRNNTARTFDLVFVKCLFWNVDEPVFIAERAVHNLHPGDAGVVQIAAGPDVKFDSIRCSVDHTSP